MLEIFLKKSAFANFMPEKKIMMQNVDSDINNSFTEEGNVKINHPVFIGKNVIIKDSEIGPYVSISDNVYISSSCLLYTSPSPRD